MVTSEKKKKKSSSSKTKAASTDNITGKAADFGEDNLTVGGFPKADEELYNLMCVWLKKNGAPPATPGFPDAAIFHKENPTMKRFSHKSFGQRYHVHKKSIEGHNWVPPPYGLRNSKKCPPPPAQGVPPPPPPPPPPIPEEPAVSDQESSEDDDSNDDTISIASSSIASSSSSDDEEEEEAIFSDDESEEEDGDLHCMSDFY